MMDIKKIEQLYELKEKGIITQEEFDQQKQEILSEPEKSDFSLSGIKAKKYRLIITLVVCFFLYIAVEVGFKSAIECKEDFSEATCSCVKEAIAVNTPFIDKLKIVIVGASADELSAHLGMADAFRCALNEI